MYARNWHESNQDMAGSLMDKATNESRNCANCANCLMRRIEVWCHLDKEVKPTLRYTCNRWKQGQQWEVLGAVGNVIYPIPNENPKN